jgi:hypothetical protein
MYHIYIYINIPLSLFHLITTTYYYYTIHYITTTEKKKKKKIFSTNHESNCLNTIKYHRYPLLKFLFFYFYYRTSTWCYLLSPLLSMSIIATTSELSISWNQISLMTLRWIIPWIFNISVNLLNKLYLNLSTQYESIILNLEISKFATSQLLSKSLLSSEDESEP